jgi:hypothetical protein
MNTAKTNPAPRFTAPPAAPVAVDLESAIQFLSLRQVLAMAGAK